LTSIRLDTNRDKGRLTEHVALKFLTSLNYSIEEINWTKSKAELDIIAKDGKFLVFVEVKSRATDGFGDPSTAVNKRKQRLLVSAASQYMDAIDYNGDFRFDLITVVGYDLDKLTLEHYPDAFFPGLDF
jgi:putative endonuclease